MQTINYQKMVRYAKRIEKQNLNKTGTSLNWCGILNGVKILCADHNSDKVDVEDDWKEQLNKFKK